MKPTSYARIAVIVATAMVALPSAQSLALTDAPEATNSLGELAPSLNFVSISDPPNEQWETFPWHSIYPDPPCGDASSDQDGHLYALSPWTTSCHQGAHAPIYWTATGTGVAEVVFEIMQDTVRVGRGYVEHVVTVCGGSNGCASGSYRIQPDGNFIIEDDSNVPLVFQGNVLFEEGVQYTFKYSVYAYSPAESNTAYLGADLQRITLTWD